MANNKPAYEARIGKIRAAVWENKGEKGVWYNVTVTRSYLDGNEWKDTPSFRPDDLLAVGKLADLAHTWCLEQRNAE
jgi:hypothetical protein